MIVTPPVITSLKLTKDNKTIGSLKMFRKNEMQLSYYVYHLFFKGFFSNGKFV